MDRRQFLAATVTLSITGLAGCAGESVEDPGETADEPTESPTAEPTETPAEGETAQRTEQQTEQPTEESTERSTDGESAYRVRISYDGEWSGTVATDGSSRTVDGTGTETFDVEGDPFIVSANAQKQDDGSGELTVQILQDGEVIAEESTSAEYGVAQVTSQDDASGGGGTESGATYAVRVQYDGEWQGSVSTGGSSRSIDGSGSRTVDIDGSPDVISANAQKQDDSDRELTVQILEEGDVVKEASTTAEYGIAQVSYTAF